MKQWIALLLAIMLLTGAACASEAPAVPQEAKSPAMQLLDSLTGLWADDDDSGEESSAPAPEAEAPHPGVEIASISGTKRGGLKITCKNNLDVTVESLDYVLLTLNEDGTLASRAESTTFRESYMDSHSYTWTLDKSLAPGKSRSDTYTYTYDVYDERYEVSLNYFPVIAAAVKSYTTEDGAVYQYASDQMRFATTDGGSIEPAAASLEPYTLTADEKARTDELPFSLTCWEIPTYAADFYGVPAGLYVNRALGGRVTNLNQMRQGDIIISFGDISATIPYACEYCELALLDGEDVTVTFWRNGEIQTTVLSIQ